MHSGARQHVEIPKQILKKAPVQYLWVLFGFIRKRVVAKRNHEKAARKISDPYKI